MRRPVGVKELEFLHPCTKRLSIICWWRGNACRRRRPVTGLLLAVGGVMPAHVQHGQWSTATLVIIGSDDCEYSQQIQATIRNTVALRMTRGCRRRQTLGSNLGKRCT